MYTNTSRNGQLTIGGNDCFTPMSRISNLTALLGDEDMWGDDTRVSGGKVLNPQRGDGLRVTLTLFLCGDVDSAGEAYDDAIDGMVSNIAWFRTNITNKTGVGDGTKSFELEWGGATVTGTGRASKFTPGADQGDGSIAATFDIWLPYGPLS